MKTRLPRAEGTLPGPISDPQSGFTLVELASVIMIAGLILVGAIAMALPMLKEARLVGSQVKMQKIAKAIDFYATKNNRVPCPAAPNLATANPPFGYERGSGANGDTVPATCGVAANKFGIVPFKTLGIPVDWITDGWGGYITYAISPAFSQDTSDAAMPVQARCRTADWYTAPITYEPGHGGTPPLYVHKNPPKARFCCPYPAAYPPATDLIVNDVNGSSQLAYARANGAADSAGVSLTATTAVPYLLDTDGSIIENKYVDNDRRATAPVYVLVSHGPNGFGAYNVQTGTRQFVASGTTDEQVNAGDNGAFFEIPRYARSGAERAFDDIVLWRTQDLILADQGQTCAVP